MPSDAACKRYKYVKIDSGLYICLQQNLAILPWLIYLKGKALGLSPRKLPEILKTARRLLGWGKRLTHYAFPFPHDYLSLELPFYGHLCLEVHRGYKIFDLRRNTVTKVFKPEVDPSTVLMEIERARAVSSYDFAPYVRCWNAEERWYEEEYINGEPIIAYTNGYPVISSDATKFLETYYQFLSPCIEKMILSQPPQRLKVAEYVRRLVSITSEMISKESCNINKSRFVSQFISSITTKLLNYEDCEIYIVLSHGDFGNNHVIKDDHGIKIIDWEYMSYRSVLFDLYSCLLEQLFFNREVHNITEQVNDAISLLQANLAVKTSIVAHDLISLTQIYRWIFYIEQTCLGIEYSNIITNGKLKWVDAFNRFEEVQAYNPSTF